MVSGQILRNIQQRLANNEFRSEQSISQGVVLRLLDELGWDIYNPQFVIPEFKIESRRVDFALCTHNKPAIFIEVKQPGNTFGADRQLFEYVFHKGVPFAIITDGNEWHFYLPGEQGDYNERRVYKLDLLVREIEESQYRFERYLSFDSVMNGTALENARSDYKNISKEREAKASIPLAWNELLAEGNEELVYLISDKVERTCGYRPNTKQVLHYLNSLSTGNMSPSTTAQKFNPSITGITRIKKEVTPKSGKTKLKVTLLDGTVIQESKVADTMVEVFRAIGFEKVAALDLKMYGYPLVSRKEFGTDKYNWSFTNSGFYILTHSNTQKKLLQLQQINDTLKLGLKIELISV